MQVVTRPYRALFVIGAALAACALMSLGCATVETDLKDVATVCRPELAPDVAAAFPLVVALAVCEAESADCSGQLQALANDGKADAQACALVELHAATVKVTAVAPTAAGAAK
jgi:hypothetical protein